MPEPPGALAGAGGYGVDKGEDVALAIFWEVDDLFYGVNCPAKDNLMRAPGGVAFVDLLEGYWFLPYSVVLVIRPEEFVDGAK